MNNYKDQIAQIIYTYDRTTDAKICMDITRGIWENEIGNVHIVHTYNGNKEFGYEKYLEDELIEIPNRGHFIGAADLINKGISYLSENTNFKYVIITASDTWFMKPKKLKNILRQIKDQNKILACSSWLDIETTWLFRTGLSTDFFILDLDWNRKTKLFPLKYSEYIKKFRDICLFLGVYPYLELAFAYYYLKYFADPLIDQGNGKAFSPALNSILRFKEREPIFKKNGIRKMSFPSFGLYTYHDIEPKKKLLKKFYKNLGSATKEFLGEL